MMGNMTKYQRIYDEVNVNVNQRKSPENVSKPESRESISKSKSYEIISKVYKNSNRKCTYREPHNEANASDFFSLLVACTK